MIYEDVSEFANELQSNNSLIGLDLGTKTIGVAVSDIILSVATPIKTIKRKKFSIDSDQLLGIISIKNCCGIVLACQKIWMGVRDPELSQREHLPEIFQKKHRFQLLFGMSDCQQ